MLAQDPWEIHRLGPDDHQHFYAALHLFAQVFDDEENYRSQQPSPEYISELLRSPHFFIFVALAEDKIIGALAGYELHKFEQMRCEHYIYDVGVHEDHRRRGIATALIARSRQHAQSRGASALFVQADLEDEPAIALYAGLGERFDVAHFEFPVGKDPDGR